MMPLLVETDTTGDGDTPTSRGQEDTSTKVVEAIFIGGKKVVGKLLLLAMKTQ